MRRKKASLTPWQKLVAVYHGNMAAASAAYRGAFKPSKAKEGITVHRSVVNDELLIAWKHRNKLSDDQPTLVIGPKGKCVITPSITTDVHRRRSYILEVLQATFNVHERLPLEDGRNLTTIHSRNCPESIVISNEDLLIPALAAPLRLLMGTNEVIVFQRFTNTPTKRTLEFQSFGNGSTHFLLHLLYGKTQKRVHVPVGDGRVRKDGLLVFDVSFQVDEAGHVSANGTRLFDAFIAV